MNFFLPILRHLQKTNPFRMGNISTLLILKSPRNLMRDFKPS